MRVFNLPNVIAVLNGSYAESGDIYRTSKKWDVACYEIKKAKSILGNKNGYNTSADQKLAENIISSEKSNIERVYTKATNHKSYVYGEYEKAIREESTRVGYASRTVKRGFLKFKDWLGEKVNRASNSRIGREFKVSIKALILGSKMFYDSMNMGPNMVLTIVTCTFGHDNNTC